MKKTFTAFLLIMCLFFVTPGPALAKAKVPRLILKSFLPLPDNRVVAYGKVVYMQADEADMDLSEERFEFFFDHRAKALPLTVSIGASSVQTLTNKEGDFVVTIPKEAVAAIKGEITVTFTSSQFPGFIETAVFNLPLQPLYLIVSDVDESILSSGEGKFFKSIGNALFKPVHRRKAIAGTPEIYRDLIKGTQGIDSLLVFLSGSPVYLAPRMQTFFDDKAFPNHALILQNVGPKEIISGIFKKHDASNSIASGTLSSNTTEYKLLQLGKLFKWYPDLPVILLGDSLAKDPEIYQQMAELFPGKVHLVVIRNITNQPLENSRYDGLKKVVNLIVWNDPIELRKDLVSANLIPDQTDQDNSKSGFGGGN